MQNLFLELLVQIGGIAPSPKKNRWRKEEQGVVTNPLPVVLESTLYNQIDNSIHEIELLRTKEKIGGWAPRSHDAS